MNLIAYVPLLVALILCQDGAYSKKQVKNPKRPNIIFILMDDLDIQLGSMQVMTKTRAMFERHGAEFVNAFVTSPICCPSRSSILTGMYAHNHGCLTNTVNCASPSWRRGPERKNFGYYLQKSGYRTGYFGKYLNNYDGKWVPTGWDNWSALLKNSKFYNYTLKRNRALERHGQDYNKDYFTDVVTNYSIDFFLESKTNQPDKPVMMVVGMAAPHGPEDPAPQHKDMFKNVTAPRHPNFNVHSNDKHWIMRYTKPMDKQKTGFSDLLHRRRLLTLLSADDAIHRLYTSLKQRRMLDNTYIFLSSDHGYHLGQFGMAKGKSQPYETDIRVPFYALGPRVPNAKKIKDIVLNIDLAPTFLDIGEVKVPGAMDGRSVLDLLGTSKNTKLKWRESFLVEKSKKLYGSEYKKPTRTKAELIKEKCRLLNYPSGCKRGQDWTCAVVNGQLRLRKCRRVTTGLGIPRRHSRSLSLRYYGLTNKRCKCLKKDRAGKSSRRFEKRSSKDVPNSMYPWSRRYSNYERHLKKESSATYNNKKSLEDQMRRINLRIKASRERLSLLRSKKKSLANMYRGSTVPEKKTCRCVNSKNSQYEKVRIYQKGKISSQKMRKRERKRLNRTKKKRTCSNPGLNCFLHTNDHWKTEPLWKNGSFCFCPTSSNNSYWCVRTINAQENYIYCEFVTSFCEFYDLNTDPYQLNNTITTLPRDFHARLHNQLEYLTSCRHSNGCEAYPDRTFPEMSIVALEKACTNRQYSS